MEDLYYFVLNAWYSIGFLTRMNILLFALLFILGYCIAKTEKPKHAEHHPGYKESLNQLFVYGFNACLTGIGCIICYGIFSFTAALIIDDYEPYDPTPSHWGPGYDNPVNTDVHEVDGYYNDNGTYVEPYLRSDPDVFESNNINP